MHTPSAAILLHRVALGPRQIPTSHPPPQEMQGDQDDFQILQSLTPFGKKRRLLRQHREELRIAVGLLRDNNLGYEFEERVMDQTKNSPFWLGHQADGMDESDDPATDPMLATQAEQESQARLIAVLEEYCRDRERNAALERRNAALERELEQLRAGQKRRADEEKKE